MLMSGRTWFDVPHNLQGVRLLPELLREGHYSTFATGKWHNGEPSFVRAFPRGKSVFFGGMADHTKVPVADVRAGKVVDRRIAEKFSSEQFADAAIDFLQSRSGEDPFFWLLAFTTPHDTRNPSGVVPGRSTTGIARRCRRTSPPQPTFDNGMTKDIRDENLAPYPRTREVIGDQLCEYYGLITHLGREQNGRIPHRARKRLAMRTTRSSSTRPTTAWRWEATACSASRASTSTAACAAR